MTDLGIACLRKLMFKMVEVGFFLLAGSLSSVFFLGHFWCLNGCGLAMSAFSWYILWKTWLSWLSHNYSSYVSHSLPSTNGWLHGLYRWFIIVCKVNKFPNWFCKIQKSISCWHKPNALDTVRTSAISLMLILCHMYVAVNCLSHLTFCRRSKKL